MPCRNMAIAAVIRPDDGDVEDLLAEFVWETSSSGVTVRDLLKWIPDETQGHRHADLVDIETGNRIRISQNPGRDCTYLSLDAGKLAAAGQLIRRAMGSQPQLILANQFGEWEKADGSFAGEVLQIASEGIPMLTVVSERQASQWQSFTGGRGVLLPPSIDAVRRWFAGVAVALRGDVLSDTIATVLRLLGPGLNGITVERAVIGQFYTGVKLSNGSAGASFTPPRPVIRSTDLGMLPKSIRQSGKRRGRPVAEFLDDIREDQCGCRALGIAVLNALADTCWRQQPHPGWVIETGVDALDGAAVRAGERVVMVGAFVGYVRRLRKAGQLFTVLELDPVALTEEERPHYRPASEAASVLPETDLLLLTGSSLLNDSIDELLALVRPETRLVMVGPSVPLLPDVLASRGADMLATIRVTDADHFLDVLAEGGGTQKTYDGSAQLVAMRRTSPAAISAAEPPDPTLDR